MKRDSIRDSMGNVNGCVRCQTLFMTFEDRGLSQEGLIICRWCEEEEYQEDVREDVREIVRDQRFERSYLV